MVINTSHGRGLLAAGLLWLSLSWAGFGAQNVTVAWVASSDPTVVGYYVSYGSASGVYTNKVNVGTNTMFTASSLVAGQTYYFVTTSYNANGIESVPTPEISFLVPGILTLTPSPASNAMRLQFPIAPALSYELQASSDLITWIDIWTAQSQNSNTWVEFDEPLTNSTPARFYRVVSH